MAKTISQRISLEGSEELSQQLKALGAAGAQAFQQIQRAAEKPIVDPAQLAQTRQAIDQLVVSAQRLAQQFQPLNDNIAQFGAAGTQATQQVKAGLDQTGAAAQQAGTTIQQAGQSAATAGQNAGRGLLSAANVFGLAAAGIVTAVSAISSALTKGAAETAKGVSDQAAALNLSIPQVQQLRSAIEGTSLASAKAGEVIGADLSNSLKNVTGLVSQAQGSWAMLKGTLSQIAVEVKGGGFVTISSFGGRTLKDYLKNMNNEGIRAATTLRSMGVSAETIAKGDTLQALREMALRIDGISNEALKAREGNRAFGASWKEVTDAILQSMAPIDKSTASLAELGKMNRQLSEADVGLGKAFLAQTNDLNNALKAAKDQVGALMFAPATAKAKWLTDLIDGTAELLRQWSRLNEFAQKGFLSGLATGPAQTAFKILVALGEQLAGIWSGVLVPAGQRLVNIISQISGRLEGVSSAQVASGFIVLAGAVGALAIALRIAGVALGPLALLFSVFSGFGPILLVLAAAVVLFWDKFKSAAETALSWIPEALHGFQLALEAALSGDFTSAWYLFAASAKNAFDTIIQMILYSEGVLGDFLRALTGGVVQTPWIAEVRDAFKEIGAELPAAILLIATAFLALRRSAVVAATAIKRIFGIELTGTGLAMMLIIGQLTGLLSAMAAVAVVVGAAFTVLGVIFSGLVAVFGIVPVALAALAVALAIAIKLVVVFWAEIKAGAAAAVTAIVNFSNELDAIVWEAIKAGATAAWNWVIAKVAEAKAAIIDFASSLPGIAWDAIAAGAAAAWAAIKAGAAEAKAAIIDFASSLPGIAWDAIKAGAAEAWGGIKQKAAEAKAAILSFAGSLAGIAWDIFASAAEAAWNRIIAMIQHSIRVLKEYIKLGPVGTGAGSGRGPGTAEAGAPGISFAGGGLMGGRGTGTSDSNLVWLSRGEHVMPARAVRQPGMLAFLEALRRSGGDLSRVIDRMGHFALGGLVPGPMAIPAFATGGLAGGNNVTIQFPGLPPVSGLRASSEVVDELRKAAALAQVRSGGRKPSRYS